MVKDRLIRDAFLVNSLEIGGAEKQTIQLFNELDDSIFRAELAYLRRKEHLVSRFRFIHDINYTGSVKN